MEQFVKKIRPLLIMAPHSADGGIAPKPKKDRPAISIIIVPIFKVAVVSKMGNILGKICL